MAEVLTRIGIPPQMMAITRQFPDGMRIRVQPGNAVRGGSRNTAKMRTIHDLFEHPFHSRDRCPPNISKDTVILAELIDLKKPPTSMGPEPAMDHFVVQCGACCRRMTPI